MLSFYEMSGTDLELLARSVRHPGGLEMRMGKADPNQGV
jgi:hypothetical protein